MKETRSVDSIRAGVTKEGNYVHAARIRAPNSKHDILFDVLISLASLGS